MPLKPGSSQETISANISELIRAGHSREQAAAIAYSEARKHKEAAANEMVKRIAKGGKT